MIKAYLAAIPSLYEGEDIEIRYSLLQEGVFIKKESIFLEYVKPAIVGLVSVLTLLEKLAPYMGEEIVIVINDASLQEVLNDTSTTKNGDIIKMAGKARRQLHKFKELSFANVTKKKEALAEWKQIIEA